MEGLRWERTVLLSTPSMRTDFFRPMRRAVTDLNLARKKKNKFDGGHRSSRNNNGVPVVSVQYDVPKTPPSPMMYRYRRHHTPCTTPQTNVQGQKNKTEDKNNLFTSLPEFPLKLSARLEKEINEERKQLSEMKTKDHLASVDNHRIKGLGVGKYYAEYHPSSSSAPGVTDRIPPSTAPLQSHDQINRIHQNLNLSSPLISSPLGGLYRYTNTSQDRLEVGQVEGHSSSCSMDVASSIRAMKGSVRDSPCQTSLSQYPAQWSGSGGPTPTEESKGFFNNSSSTPSVPYSTADILYGSEVNARPPVEDLRQNSLDLERSKELSRLKAKELEQHPNNRRPSSKSASKKSLTIEAVNLEREKEDPIKGNNSATLPPTKPNHFRPNGIRSNILKGEQMYSSKTNGALSGRDPDDLVAMGTLWSPNNANPSQSAPSTQQQMSSRNSISNNISSNAFPGKPNQSSSNVNPSMSASTTMTPQRKYTSNNMRPIVVQNNSISGIRNNLKEKEKDKDAEPKYSDPLIGAPASYQQRLIELGALEGDTVRWERTKRLKKKKQDRDS